jgi:hypothetical protein
MAADLVIKKVGGGAGIKSSEINTRCGVHKNWASTPTVIDLSTGSATVNLFAAVSAGRIQKVTAVYPEAISADGDGTIVCGSLLYASGTLVTDADKFATAIPTASAAIGTVQEITLTSTVTFVAGEVITVGHTIKTGAGTAHITVEYTIDDQGF